MQLPRHRLYVETRLEPGAVHICDSAQANYLINVLRLSAGDEILVFDGRNGEWLAAIAEMGRGRCTLAVGTPTRQQVEGPDIHYLFAPLKRARLDYMVQKAVELGVARLVPVKTRRTQVARLNQNRMRANVIEAAEQCGVLRLPEIDDLRDLSALLADWRPERRLIYCDEQMGAGDPMQALGAIDAGPLALLVGPEGGFDDQEREALRAKPFVTAISLGPRVMRADTAGVAALALINAAHGDWR
jgi:16S rRNA (uracil1498-N3)-methyltransferase